MTTEPFTVTAEIAYRPYRVPPRCRKPRPVPETFARAISIPTATSEQAPVVAIVPDDHGHLGSARGGNVEMRAYKGQLYVASVEGATPVRAGSPRFPDKVKHKTFESDRHEAVLDAERLFKGLLIIDGEVWKVSAEPSYTVVTLGMGAYLDLSLVAKARAARQFPVTEYDAAVQAALELTRKMNGDAVSYRMIRETPKVTVLDPTAFKIPTEAERIAGAEEEIRSRIVRATAMLAGTISHDALRDAKKAIEEADSLLWQHGLETLAAKD